MNGIPAKMRNSLVLGCIACGITISLTGKRISRLRWNSIGQDVVHMQSQVGYRHEFSKNQQKHSLPIHWLYEIYNKEYFMFYYYSQIVLYICITVIFITKYIQGYMYLMYPSQFFSPVIKHLPEYHQMLDPRRVMGNHGSGPPFISFKCDEP